MKSTKVNHRYFNRHPSIFKFTLVRGNNPKSELWKVKKLLKQILAQIKRLHGLIKRQTILPFAKSMACISGPAREFDGDLTRALEQTTTKFLVLSFSTDWRFSPERSQEIVDALIRARKNVASAIIESEHGHDSFLLPINRYTKILSAFLQRSYAELEDISRSSQTTQGDLSWGVI